MMNTLKEYSSNLFKIKPAAHREMLGENTKFESVVHAPQVGRYGSSENMITNF